MKYLNEFETTTLKDIEVVIDERSGTPRFIGSCVKARKCIKCNLLFFVNYTDFDYECMKCRIKA